MMTDGLRIAAREERVTDYILPVKICLAEGELSHAETLLRSKPLQVTTREEDYFSVRGKAAIVLDFGKEICGGVRILAFRAGCSVRLRFGESLSETCSETGPGKTATNDHAARDFTVTLPFMSDQRFGQTGFRFLRIDFFEGTQLDIVAVVGAFEHLNLSPRGSFRCSDPLLNEIYDVAAYTVSLCMQSMLWDGIKRDRLVWIGDMHPETMAIHALYGHHDLVTRSLAFEKQRSPLPLFMNGKATYSLWWMCIVADEYMQNGDQMFLRENIDYIVELIDLVAAAVDRTGMLIFSNERNDYFLDWPTFGYEERKAGVQALCAYALQKIKPFLPQSAARTAEQILIGLNKNADGRRFKQVAALKALAGHLSGQDAAATILRGGASGLSTFMSYYIFSALSEAGKTREALSLLREYYGGMLGRGATTFWEDFDIAWLKNSGRIDSLPVEGEKDIHGDFGAYCYKGYRHSLCHGWAGGPVPYLAHYVLGVKPLQPGYVSVEIHPDLGDLEYAEGTIPTPRGDLKVLHRRCRGEIITEVEAPQGITVERENFAGR